MNQKCECIDSIRRGSFQGVKFTICTNCKYLDWTNPEGLTFIRSDFILQLRILGNKLNSIGDLLSWVEKCLVEFEASGKPRFKIDFKKMGLQVTPEQASPSTPQRPSTNIQELVSDSDLSIEELNLLGDALLGYKDGQLSMVDPREFLNYFDLVYLFEESDPDLSFDIPIYDDLTTWDIWAAEDGFKEHFPLKDSKLHEYTTEEIFRAIFDEIWDEMGEYIQFEKAKDLKSYFSSLSYLSQSLHVQIDCELNYPLPLPVESAPVLEEDN